MPKLSGKEDWGGRNMKPCRTGLGRIKVRDDRTAVASRYCHSQLDKTQWDT